MLVAARPTLAPSLAWRRSPGVACVASWRDDVPNALTASRVLAVPLLVGAFYAAPPPLRSRVSAGIFAACAATDWLDGWLARRWDVHSEFGAFLDPVADKLLVCSCLVLLSGALGAVVALPTAVIVSREVGVSALRQWMGERGLRDAVAVGWWGKLKTASQMLSLQLLLLGGGAASSLRRAGLALLYMATVLTCTSAAGYLSVAWPVLTARAEPTPEPSS